MQIIEGYIEHLRLWFCIYRNKLGNQSIAVKSI